MIELEHFLVGAGYSIDYSRDTTTKSIVKNSHVVGLLSKDMTIEIKYEPRNLTQYEHAVQFRELLNTNKVTYSEKPSSEKAAQGAREYTRKLETLAAKSTSS